MNMGLWGFGLLGLDRDTTATMDNGMIKDMEDYMEATAKGVCMDSMVVSTKVGPLCIANAYDPSYGAPQHGNFIGNH